MLHPDQFFLQEALRLARQGMESGAGGPFGCVIVRDGLIVGSGHNRVLERNDPTAHAEVVAIRDACSKLRTFQLDHCIVYSTCEPCPMCLGAIYWARPARLVFSATRDHAASVGFDDAFIYRELALSNEERAIPTDHVFIPEIFAFMQEWEGKGKAY